MAGLPELGEDLKTHWRGGWRTCGVKGQIVAVIPSCASPMGLGLIQLWIQARNRT